MMSDLRALYEEVLLDHNRRPRNFQKRPEGSNHHAHGYNPVCGDEFTVHLKVEDGIIKDVGFEGAGCAISTASASLMTEALKGKSEDEARALFRDFREMVTKGGSEEELGKLAVFSGVREFPMRVKCATLAWHTFEAALDQKDGAVSTE